jgi:tRNA A37 threonylcarbamoyladenosine biosynthesis protein TsaE
MIYLFGDYGSGKTTIIKLLKDFLLKYKMIEGF